MPCGEFFSPIFLLWPPISHPVIEYLHHLKSKTIFDTHIPELLCTLKVKEQESCRKDIFFGKFPESFFLDPEKIFFLNFLKSAKPLRKNSAPFWGIFISFLALIQ